jgi:hypothetical protein
LTSISAGQADFVGRIGCAKTVVDELQRWVDEADVDGFNLSHAISPGTFEDIIEWVIPELKQRGVFWDPKEAEGLTMRENFLADGLGPRVSSFPSTLPPHQARDLIFLCAKHADSTVNCYQLRDDHPGSRHKWPSPRGNISWAMR